MVLAHLSESGGKWDDARVVSEKRHAVDPASSAAGYNLASLDHSHGVDTVPANARLQYDLGMACLVVNRPESAAQSRRRPLSGNRRFARSEDSGTAPDSIAKRARK